MEWHWKCISTLFRRQQQSLPPPSQHKQHVNANKVVKVTEPWNYYPQVQFVLHKLITSHDHAAENLQLKRNVRKKCNPLIQEG